MIGLVPRCAVVAMLAGAAAQVTFAGPPSPRHQREDSSCGTNIVSATVVATFCGHREDESEVMDLFILWRGRPGWFQRGEGGPYGSRGSGAVGPGSTHHVVRYDEYGGITVGFEADFDARILTIGGRRIALDAVNAVLVDRVEQGDESRTVTTLRISARLPLLGDPNEVVVRRSRDLVRFLQCEIAMPVPRTARGPIPQPPVITVCEKLQGR